MAFICADIVCLVWWRTFLGVQCRTDTDFGSCGLGAGVEHCVAWSADGLSVSALSCLLSDCSQETFLWFFLADLFSAFGTFCSFFGTTDLFSPVHPIWFLDSRIWGKLGLGLVVIIQIASLLWIFLLLFILMDSWKLLLPLVLEAYDLIWKILIS